MTRDAPRTGLSAAIDRMKVDLIRWYVGGSIGTAFLIVTVLKW